MIPNEQEQRNELNLIKAARKGDVEAENALFTRNYKFMKRAHEFGPDGCFGGSKKSLCSNFETALADGNIYDVFKKCVATYDPTKGSFQTHLGFRMRMAAKDRIRKNANPKYRIATESTMSDLYDGSEDPDGGNKLCTSFEKASAKELRIREAEEKCHDATFWFIDSIEKHYGPDSIETRYMELFLMFGQDNKKHTQEICNVLGCSRQTLTNIKKRIDKQFGDKYLQLLESLKKSLRDRSRDSIDNDIDESDYDDNSDCDD